MHNNLGEKFLLNNGVVRLLDFMGGDIGIVRAARVSYDAAWRAGEDEANDKKLMRRLWRGKPEPIQEYADGGGLLPLNPLPELPKHTTPFEACTMTFEIMAPIFVFRQWHRHRTQSYNELSARYRELPETFYLPTPDVIGVQSTDNKQGRTTGQVEPDFLEERLMQILDVKNHCESAFQLYRDLIAVKWPKELARIVLPMGTYSHMFCTMNLLNFFRFANLRSDSHAQYEIRVYAEAMLEMVADICPVAAELFQEANPHE